MTKHIKIKVLTRLPNYLEKWHKEAQQVHGNRYYIEQGLELINGRVYNVQWINKHDTSLDKMFNNPLDQLESLNIR